MRRHDDFALCEDAVQEALLAAAAQWPDAVPANPRGWLLTVASRRLVDLYRSEAARRRREVELFAMQPADQFVAPGADTASPPHGDDTLVLLMLCCHPSLPPEAQTALTLRAVGGLTTDEVARAFLTSETTMKQRITRAKQRVKASGTPFRMPPETELPARIRVVLHVLYLIFNEGYAASAGPELLRTDHTAEAIRLTREVHRRRPDDGEVAGLLALMLFTDARRPARTSPDGLPIPLDEQDRTRWDQAMIAEADVLLTGALEEGAAGPYQLQAAIAAVHAAARQPEDTDWPQILGLYDVLQHVAPSPVVALNRAVAVAMVDGPQAALELLGDLADDHRLVDHHRLEAVRGHMLEMAGDMDAARASYGRAAAATPSVAERRYLEGRRARLAG